MNKKLDSSEGTKLAELNNALFEAAEKSSLSKVKALVEKGADVNSKHGRFELPVLLNALTVWRLSKSRIEIIQWLINNGADVNLQDNAERTPLQEACSHDRLDIAQLLIKKGAAIAQSDGSTLLHHAVNGKNNSNEELWDFLLGLDIDINCQRRDNKRTALHYAVYIQNLKATKFLIEKGADINLRDHERKTPFEIACECKMEKIIAVFEKRGLGQRKTLVKKRRPNKTSYKLDVFAQKLGDSIVEEVNANEKQIKTPIYKLKIMYPSFEDILPNGVFVGFSDGKGDFELDIELPDTVIPGHQDLVEEDDHVLPAFLEENELDNDFIYWGDINQLPLSLLRYEIISAAQKSAEALSASGIQFRTAPEICIGDGDEDTGDAQEYLQKIKDELKKKVPKKDKRLREAMAALFYNSDEKQKWFISL